MYVTQHICT